MENEDASHKYAPLFDVYHHLLIVPRIFDCFNQRFPKMAALSAVTFLQLMPDILAAANRNSYILICVCIRTRLARSRCFILLVGAVEEHTLRFKKQNQARLV